MTIAGGLASVLFALTSNAQQAGLVQDQNPRYEEARARYMNKADSLTSTQGTTIQNTYKAYDWYEAREERRKQRRENNFRNNMLDYSLYGGPFFYPTMRFNNFGMGYGYGFGNRFFGNRYRFGW